MAKGKAKRSEEKLFVKKAGGPMTLKIDGKRKKIKAGQTFYAVIDEIPKAFRDVIQEQPSRAEMKELDKKVTEANKKEAVKKDSDKKGVVKSPLFEVIASVEKEGFFDVVNTANGKKLNEKELPADEAKALVDELLAENN